MGRAGRVRTRRPVPNLRTRGVATISLSAAPFSSGLIASALTLLALAASLGILLLVRPAIFETTLVSAWWWTLVALVGWGGALLIAASGWASDRAWLALLRFAAISLSFCPLVALIGAKRPQHTAWNFVVVSLWAIVVLPAGEAFFLHPGRPVEMGDARGWFLWILILLGPINFVPTRHWLSALLLAGGQFLALSQHLLLVRRDLFPQSAFVAFALITTAILVAWARRRSKLGTSPYDRLWLDFRDTFGLFWSLRVQERINAAAQQYDWPLVLTWSGFCDKTNHAPLAAIDPSIEPVLRATLKGLLRRFVSNRWIAERRSEGLD